MAAGDAEFAEFVRANSARLQQVTVFWFRPADAAANQGVTGVAAYDRSGRKLVSGDPGFGVG